MEIKEFNKKYILNFTIKEEKETDVEFELNTIDRNTLHPTLAYKRVKTETPLDWIQERIGEEILAGNRPDVFVESFYDNVKRKMINTHLIKNNIKGFNPLDTKESIDFLFL